MNATATIDSLHRLGGILPLSVNERREVRRIAGASFGVLTSIVEGDCPPVLVGEHGHYVTRTGKRVHNPNAYKRAWGKCTYVKSTVRVEVGSAWLVEWREWEADSATRSRDRADHISVAGAR